MSQAAIVDLDSFWHFLSVTVQQLCRHNRTDDVVVAERLLARAEDCEAVLQAVFGRVIDQEGSGDIIQDLAHLLEVLEHHRNHYAGWILRIEPRCTDNFLSQACPVQPPTGPGRPAYNISKEDIESLFEVGFTFLQSARILGVSERTLWRRREEYGLSIGQLHTCSMECNQS